MIDILIETASEPFATSYRELESIEARGFWLFGTTLALFVGDFLSPLFDMAAAALSLILLGLVRFY